MQRTLHSPSPMPWAEPKALLFDLGGVLIDIDFSRALSAWQPLSALSSDEMRSSFRFDEAYARHERGDIGAHEYFSHLANVLQLSGTAQQIEAGWNAIFVGEIAPTRRLVETMRRKLPCHAFTNTNASHMSAWSALFPAVVAAFDSVFASHQMGLRKPERAAFEHICHALSLAPESILFFDDLEENVLAARDAGLGAALVRSPADVDAALHELGLTLSAEPLRQHT